MAETPDKSLGSTVTVGQGGGPATGSANPSARSAVGSSPPRSDYPSLELISPDHYVVGDELARGGMGRVMRARDRRLGREVAIKLPAKQTAEQATRLEREARITAQLQHPAIVTVHEAGVWPGHEPFYAMELIAGRRLGEAIAAARTIEDRLGLLPHMIAVADALAYAHAKRIIHRDLKPSNVLVGEFGETVVIDWGLAKDLAAPATQADASAEVPALASPEQTVDGSILGTPSYMPPEQAAGKPVDERADVYALGAMLYHLLAGVAPYTAATTEAILSSVLAGPPRPIAKLAPDAPLDLVTIVTKAMQPEPVDRYPSARELADDLRRFQTGQLVGSHHYTASQLIGRWVRRHRAVLTMASVLLAILIVVSVISVQRIIRARESAEREQRRAETQRGVAEQGTARARKAEAQVQTQLDQLRAEQAARTKAEVMAQERGSEVEMTKEQLQLALASAERQRALAEHERATAEAESARAREAEQRAAQAAVTEKKTREETERLYRAEKARAEALEAAPARTITTQLPR